MTNFHQTEISFIEKVQHYFLGSLRYGMGCAWLGRDYENKKKVDEEIQTLTTAYDLGFRYFDTSEAYGLSEKVVGLFTPSVPRDRIFLATKSRLPDPSTPQAANDHLLRNLDESLRRLKTDYLDLYQVHDVETLTNVLGTGGVLETLINLKYQGIIRYCGLATRSHTLLETAARHGGFDTILTYSDYTLLNRSAAQLIHTAARLGIGVINASPLAGSTKQGLNLKDQTILAAALQFPLTNPEIHINLTGPANVQEVQSSVKALTLAVDWSRWKGD